MSCIKNVSFLSTAIYKWFANDNEDDTLQSESKSSDITIDMKRKNHSLFISTLVNCKLSIDPLKTILIIFITQINATSDFVPRI